MNNTIREQLLGYLLGALDESEQNFLKEQLKHKPGLRRELAKMRQKIWPLAPTRDDFMPPPGLAFRTCELVATVRKPEASARECAIPR